ncbi:PTS sugar transporter subunit IIB [Lacticaseibacillus thailandensis]|uniref:PTS EIIB type-3 domain-containing protein n=1 Tax=Lacticaseibacillus thailandensis DSM 22698 = JCM 13996 TaxID=1423810 RepID=A0A0R2C5G5_9LACO|nr:PTS sugar transporter subunit IIB [Lacticaseibacillus thailandensis]KRM86759.1 hypothetical protein FD19_GL001612 [Lacticaseibacillus thailandensis DSM 22698 = JCM 13996]
MAQKNILLVCSAGMSTGLLVSRMEAAAANDNVDVQVVAIGAAEVNNELVDMQPDVILVGPQVRYLADQLQSKLDVPVAVMNTHDYAGLDGERLLQTALDTIAHAPTCAS